ncbi:MAG TPA: DUF222 domain-containing protein [Gammaproteobacteria bacterium]
MAVTLRTSEHDPYHPCSGSKLTVELECLGAEITELWGHINAATHRFLELVAEFDRREGWAYEGCASCAQWLNWQCGIGAVAAREKVRVARALESLPKIREAFRLGVVSYSKVRAMTRVATPENEDILLNVAEHGTASHLGRLVQKYRRAERMIDAERAQRRHTRRSLYYYYDADGSLVIQARLPAEVGAVVRKAIEAAMAALEEEKEGGAAQSVVAERGASAETSPGGPEPFASSASAETLPGGPELEPGASAETPAAVDRVSPAPRALPQVPAAVGNGAGVSAETPSPAALPEADEATHADRFEHDRIGARRADALHLLAERFLMEQTAARASVADRYQVVVHVDQRLLAGHVAGDSCGGRCELEDDQPLALETVRRLACDCSVVGLVVNAAGEPLDLGRKKRTLSAALRRALRARDGGCRFPTCTHTRWIEGHHVVHWANGGETKLDNLCSLCAFHHRLVHEGGFGMRTITHDDGRVDFVFTRPDGSVIEPNGRHRFRGIAPRERAPRSPQSDPPPPEEEGRRLVADGEWTEDPGDLPLYALSREAGLAISWRTARSKWIGEKMDYGLAAEALFRCRDARAQRAAMAE